MSFRLSLVDRSFIRAFAVSYLEIHRNLCCLSAGIIFSAIINPCYKK